MCVYVEGVSVCVWCWRVLVGGGCVCGGCWWGWVEGVSVCVGGWVLEGCVSWGWGVAGCLCAVGVWSSGSALCGDGT